MKPSDFNKLSKLLTQFPYYTKQNLSLALGKDGYNLDYWIKQLIKEEVLIPLKKGVYASAYYIRQIKEKKQGFFDIYLQQLANTLCQPSYISLEYVLSYYDLIPEASYTLTSITTKSTRTYKSKLVTFAYRNIKDSLFTGYKPKTSGNPVQRATKAKALFDYLYLKKFTNKNDIKEFLLERSRINWDWFLSDSKNIKEFNSYVDLSCSKKMEFIAQVIKSIK